MLSVDELYAIMILLDTYDLQALCSTSSTYQQLCQNPNFWKNKIVHDHLPMFNNPSSLNDYVKIKEAYDIQLKYEAKTNLIIKLTTEDLSLILPKHNYDQIINFDYDQVELYLHYFKTSNIPITINYKSMKNNKRIELKVLKMTREEILEVIFKIAYYYPYLV